MSDVMKRDRTQDANHSDSRATHAQLAVNIGIGREIRPGDEAGSLNQIPPHKVILRLFYPSIKPLKTQENRHV